MFYLNSGNFQGNLGNRNKFSIILCNLNYPFKLMRRASIYFGHLTVRSLTFLQVKSRTRLSAVTVIIITCTDRCQNSYSVIHKRRSTSRIGQTTSLMSFAGILTCSIHAFRNFFSLWSSVGLDYAS